MDCDSGRAVGFRDILEYFRKVGQILLEEGTIIKHSLTKKRAIMSTTFPLYHTLLILSLLVYCHSPWKTRLLGKKKIKFMDVFEQHLKNCAMEK